MTVWQLGVFDHQGDGIQGETTLTVQLYTRRGNSGTLLETLHFDATSPGKLVRGHRFKPLPVPVTLLPGAYTIAAWGFDKLNPEGNAGNKPYVPKAPPWTMNDGGGLLRFEGGGRFGYAGVNAFPRHPDAGPVNRYAAATFVFSAADLPAPSHATHHAALVAGVASFPVECCLGSLAVFGQAAFPVIAEPGGRRLVFAAAGFFQGKPDGARGVAFAHTQFAHATNDGRAALFDNAIRWASRKRDGAEIVVGLGPRLDGGAFARRGFTVKLLSTNLATAETDLSGCDVLVADAHASFTPAALAQVAAFNAQGGGLVLAATPWAISYRVAKPEFVAANWLLDAFGLAYRDSQAGPRDWGFTNVATHPWPAHFSAWHAAHWLHQERQGRVRLSSFDKMIALGTINHTLTARPDLLCDLTATCAGQSPANLTPAAVSGLVDLVVLDGAAALPTRLGDWATEGRALVARNRRGAVAYELTLPVGDVYRLRIEGGQALRDGVGQEFPLVLSVNGTPVGRYTLDEAGRAVECWLPWLPAGAHQLRVFWDNAASRTALRLDRVTLQTGLGADSDGDGTKDWVEQRLRMQSGFDLTNTFLASYTSPVCLEGRDPYLPALRLWLSDPTGEPRHLRARPAPNDRWFADVPLPEDPSKRATLEASFQHGAFTETRQLQWLPLDLLTAESLMLRQGDSLLFTVGAEAKDAGEMVIMVGTNRLADRHGLPVPYAFTAPGDVTVTGTWTRKGGSTVSRSITVRVVGHRFPPAPACWVGKARDWDVPAVPPETLIEADSRLFCVQTATLPNHGRRYSLLIDANEPRPILSRLGEGGPVLDAVQAQGLQVYSSSQTSIAVVDTRPDGTRIVEMLLVSDPLPPGAALQLDIFVGGVTFADGTTTLRLTAADFDALGQYRVRFFWPAETATSVCHRITLVQDDQTAGIGDR